MRLRAIYAETSRVAVRPKEHTRGAWSDSPRLAMAIRVLVVLVPLAVSFVATWLIAREWASPESLGAAIGRFIVLALVATAVAASTDRLARRFLPLAALFRLSLVFPDEAPSRFAIALRSNNTKKLEKRLAELETEGFTGTETEAAHLIVELAASLSKHDRLTRGHSERVRAFSALIGEEMGLSPEDNNKLQWAALIHDVGKLRIPYEILTKPERLSEEEFEVIKTHPEEGMRLAAPLAGFLGTWIDAVGQHHERFDGGGYPNGLVGNQISLGGRIVAVADTYDVITAARSYKPPQSPEYARKELARCAGSQFDPEVVRAFLNVGLGRVRRTMWPLSWAMQIPFIGTAVTAPVAQTVAATVVTLATATGVAAMDGGLDAVVDAPAAVAFVETFSDGDRGGAGEFAAAEASLAPAETTAPPRSAVANAATVDSAPPISSVAVEAPAAGGEPAPNETTTTQPSLTTVTTAPVTSTTVNSTTAPTTAASSQITVTTVTTVAVDVPATTIATTAAPSTTASTTVAPTVPPPTDPPPVMDDCGRAAAGALDLIEADLNNCDLTGANLAGADLEGADLTGAVLTSAVLDGANLAQSVLRAARLENVSAVGTNFLQADLRDVEISGGTFTNAVLFDSRAEGASIVGASFAGADLRGARLKEATISQTSLQAADLTNASLERAVVSGSNLSQIDGTRVNAKEASFSDVSFDYAKLDNAKFWLADIDRTSFSFAHAELQGVDFDQATLSNGSMMAARFPAVWFGEATFTNWNLADSLMPNAWLRESNPSGGLTAAGADLSGSDWRWTDLSGLAMDNGDFTGASFAGTVGTPFNHATADLAGATCSNNQPAGGNPPTCW